MFGCVWGVCRESKRVMSINRSNYLCLTMQVNYSYSHTYSTRINLFSFSYCCFFFIPCLQVIPHVNTICQSKSCLKSESFYWNARFAIEHLSYFPMVFSLFTSDIYPRSITINFFDAPATIIFRCCLFEWKRKRRRKRKREKERRNLSIVVPSICMPQIVIFWQTSAHFLHKFGRPLMKEKK